MVDFSDLRDTFIEKISNQQEKREWQLRQDWSYLLAVFEEDIKVRMKEGQSKLSLSDFSRNEQDKTRGTCCIKDGFLFRHTSGCNTLSWTTEFNVYDLYEEGCEL